MAWNEPGGGNRDPWGGGGRSDGNPPDLDEVLRKAREKFDRFFGGGKARGNGGSNPSGGNRGLVGIVLAGLFALWVWQGIHIVDEKEAGVVLRFGEFHSVIAPGFNWQPWLVDTVYIEGVTNEQQYAASDLMITQDENIVRVPITVQFNISDVRSYVLNVNDPIGTLQQAADSAIRHVVGSTLLADVLGEGREILRDEVKRRLQDYLDDYGTGINVIDVTLQRAEPPDAVRDAFDDVSAAEADRNRLINQARAYSNGVVPVARGQAQRMIEEANAYAGQVVERARGEANRFKLLLTEYQRAPQVTRQRLYIDTMQSVLGNSSKVLIDVEGGNNLLYLPLDQLVNRPPPAASSGVNSGGAGSMTELSSGSTVGTGTPIQPLRSTR